MTRLRWIGLMPALILQAMLACAQSPDRAGWPGAKTDPFWPAQAPAAPAKLPPTPAQTPLPESLKPVAPPFEYRYLGSIALGADKRVVFLINGDRVISVNTGQTLDGDYVIEAIDETRITVQHPALDQPIVLNMDPSAAYLPLIAAAPAALSSGTEATVAPIWSAVAPARDSLSAPGNATAALSGAADLALALSAPQVVQLAGDVDIGVKASVSAPLRVLPIAIAYDPAHLRFKEFLPGDLVANDRETAVSHSIDVPSGRIVLSVVRSGAGAIVGDGVVGTIRFVAVTPGDADTSVAAATPIGAIQAVTAPALPPPVRVHIQ